MEHAREIEIENLVLSAIFEAQSDSFWSIKATRILLLRSDIDKKAKELKESSPELKEKFEIISTQLLEAERVLGELVKLDKAKVNYVPITKKEK